MHFPLNLSASLKGKIAERTFRNESIGLMLDLETKWYSYSADRDYLADIATHACISEKGELGLMEEKDAFERVKKVAVAQLSVNPDEVTLEASFTKDLGADSLDTVELVMALEEEFGMEIPDEDAEKITTVGEAVKYIAAHL